ncbi:MAG: hypothetical protein HY744_15245 [Deltaproteobacteria bacterium]|nr:hypothetical protein [Deltaproteobacteria bacterium]
MFQNTLSVGVERKLRPTATRGCTPGSFETTSASPELVCIETLSRAPTAWWNHIRTPRNGAT